MDYNDWQKARGKTLIQGCLWIVISCALCAIIFTLYTM